MCCDAILHAGDVNNPEILDVLRTIAPLYVVRGNNDQEWGEELPQSLAVELGGVRILMIHNKRELPMELGDAQLIVFGHSHKYFEQTIDSRLWLNPGSCGKRRFDQEISFALLRIDGGALCVQKVVLPRHASLQPLYSFSRKYVNLPLPAGLRKESLTKRFYKTLAAIPCCLSI